MILISNLENILILIFVSLIVSIDGIYVFVELNQTLCLFWAVAGEWRRRCVGFLQWPCLFPGAAKYDVVSAGGEWCSSIPHHPSGAAGSLHRGQERWYRAQVQLTSAAWWHCQSGHVRRLHSRGDGTLTLPECSLEKHTMAYLKSARAVML